MWSNGVKTAFFFKKLRKIAQRLGALPPDPCQYYVWITVGYTSLLNTSPNLNILRIDYLFKPSSSDEFVVTCQHQATASDFPFHDIFAPTKNSSFKVSDDVIACDLWFTSPPTNQKSRLRLCCTGSISRNKNNFLQCVLSPYSPIRAITQCHLK